MQVAIRKMGNSQGVLIPKPFLVQVGFEDAADMQVRNGVIEIRPIKRNPREDWAKDSQRIALAGDDKLVWHEFANEGDAELVW
ncbi:MAG: AbrB/MazE/SpoVT family DNA-binding domain-containing protein [Polaromonas sp.]